jgi:hypothetical protein
VSCVGTRTRGKHPTDCPSTGVTRLHRYYEPLRHPKRPGLSLTSCPLIRTTVTAGTSRVAHDPLCLHAVAKSPAVRMEFVRSYDSIRFGLPRNRGGSAPASTFSRPAQRLLTLQRTCSPGRLATRCTRGFSGLVASTAALIAAGWSEPVPGRVYPRCGPSPFHGAPGDSVYRYESSKILNKVMRGYQPIWRIRSWMSPL